MGIIDVPGAIFQGIAVKTIANSQLATGRHRALPAARAAALERKGPALSVLKGELTHRPSGVDDAIEAGAPNGKAEGQGRARGQAFEAALDPSDLAGPLGEIHFKGTRGGLR